MRAVYIKESDVTDVIIGASTIVVVCILVLVLARQFQMRALTQKIDKLLERSGSN